MLPKNIAAQRRALERALPYLDRAAGALTTAGMTNPEGFTITPAPANGEPVRVVATLTKDGDVRFPDDLTMDEAKRAIAELMVAASAARPTPEGTTP